MSHYGTKGRVFIWRVRGDFLRHGKDNGDTTRGV